MLERLKNFICRRTAQKRGQLGSRPLIDAELIERTFSRSKVPVVFIMVLVWVVSVLLLTISSQQQRDLFDWVVGQKAPITLHAKVDFNYVDLAATEAARRSARESAPDFFVQDEERAAAISKAFSDYFRIVRDGERFADNGSEAAAAALGISPALKKALTAGRADYPAFWTWLGRHLQRGVMSRADKGARNPLKKVRVVDGAGRASQALREIGEFTDPGRVSELLARELLEGSGEVNEFAVAAVKLIGGDGTLRHDSIRTGMAARNAEDQVVPIVRSKARNDLLIRKGDVYTAEARAMIAAERDRVDSGNIQDFGELYENMLWSLIILLGAVFFYFRFSPSHLRDNRKMLIAGLVVIAALFINFGAIRGFALLRESTRTIPYLLVIDAVPVAVVAALMTVLIGGRAALCASLLVCAITAMMIMPDRSFELAVRWITICIGVTLAVRWVNNYRDFFLRVFSSIFVVTWIVNASLLFFVDGSLRDSLLNSTMIVLINAFVAAVVSLVLVFVFELVFNVNTDMSLMVLCSGNHPLLERLKREAPGTMHHSTTVATLSEDAARAIGCNPLRAKAGALFHDIGKLVRPQFFVENNPDSVSLHVNLNPHMSNIIIRDHVKEGLLLARQYRMSRLIRSAISSHHGDDLVRYFYAKAVAEARSKLSGGAPVLEVQFRYQGNPPVSKELCIVSLADACEAACRSIDKLTPDKVRDMVDGIFMQRFEGGQLRASELTLAELNKVRECFISTLIGMNHGRIAYPAPPGESHEDSALPLEESPASEAAKK